MENLYDTFYYFSVCHVCKSTDNRKDKILKRCGGCKLISYCSTSHQKLHWSAHKMLCKCIQAFLTTENKTHLFQDAIKCTSFQEWSKLISSLMLLIQLRMGRRLSQAEQQMFMFPRVCELCRNAKQDCMLNCRYCHCVSYCSVLHEEQDSSRHRRVCQELALCLSLDKFLVQAGDVYAMIDVPVPVANKCEVLPSDIEKFITKFISFDDVYKWNQHHKIALLSEFLSCPLTIMYALQILGINLRRKLEIHVVGAGFYECSYLKKWEMILHFVPEFRNLNIIFIGPEAGQDLEPKCELCEGCQSKGCELSVTFLYNQLYHQFATSDSFSAPDIIVAYNCGFHEYENSDDDSWGPTLPYLVKYEHIPLLLTSYTNNEAEKDIQRILNVKDTGIKVILNCQENPYSSKRPYRDWDSEHSKVFYQNKYVSIVVPSKN